MKFNWTAVLAAIVAVVFMFDWFLIHHIDGERNARTAFLVACVQVEPAEDCLRLAEKVR